MIQGCGYRQHRPFITVSGRHQFTSQAGKIVEGGAVKYSAGAKCCQFAVTVAGKGRGTDSEIVDHAPGAEADRAKGGLGDFGGPQTILVVLTPFNIEHRARIDKIGQALRAVGREGQVGLFEVVEKSRKLTG